MAELFGGCHRTCCSLAVDWHSGGRRVAVQREAGSCQSRNFRRYTLDRVPEQGKDMYSHRLQRPRMGYSNSTDSPPFAF